MKQLVCEMCGGRDLVKQDGVFVCQNCGTKYSVEEAKKMMVEGRVSVEGTVAVEGTVKVDKSNELHKLYTLARRAKENDNAENACRYYRQIEEQDPSSWEAYFYLIYFEASTTTLGAIPNECKNLINCFKTTMQLLSEARLKDAELRKALHMMQTDIMNLGALMASSANELSSTRERIFYHADVLAMMEELGNNIMNSFPKYSDIAADAWKAEIDVYISIIYDEIVVYSPGNSTGYVIYDVVEKIQNADPSYEDPFNSSGKQMVSGKLKLWLAVLFFSACAVGGYFMGGFIGILVIIGSIFMVGVAIYKAIKS